MREYSILLQIKEAHSILLECNCGIQPCHGLYIQTRENQIECVYGMQAHGTLDDHPLLEHIRGKNKTPRRV